MDSVPVKTRKTVGLALSGGFIRATAHIGVIEVLEEHGIPIDIISACSSGAGIAAAYASGTLAQAKKRLSDGKAKDYFQVIFEPGLPKHGFLKGQRNKKFFEEFVGDKQFSDLNKKLIVNATDILTMQQVWLEDGSVSEAIQASTAVPGVFVPVEKDGKLLVDGANFNLIPSEALYHYGADYVIAIDVSQPPNIFTRSLSNFKRLLNRQKTIAQIKHKPLKNPNIIKLIIRAFNLSGAQIQKFYHHGYSYDILIKPEVQGVKRWSVSLVDYCIQEGRKAALEAVLQIKKDLDLI